MRHVVMKKLFVVGIGPGSVSLMTEQARKAIAESEIVCGYPKYIKNIRSLLDGKEIYETGMRQEVERCQKAIEFATSGKTTSMVSSGDAGVYGMAGLIYELARGAEIELEVVPGLTSVLSAAAELGAPLMHDFAVISLSDILTEKELITKRLNAASAADFVIALYNPKSNSRPDNLNEAIAIIKKHKKSSTPIGIVRNSGTDVPEVRTATLETFTDEGIDMSTIVIIGNQSTVFIDGKMVTPRGYRA